MADSSTINNNGKKRYILEKIMMDGELHDLDVQEPTAENNPATKKYVDDLVGDIAAILDSINGEAA